MQEGVLALQKLLARIDEVLEQMPPVRHLLRVRRPFASTIGIRPSSIATNQLHARMGLQPLRNRLCRAVG
jgi:hypothetical protein